MSTLVSLRKSVYWISLAVLAVASVATAQTGADVGNYKPLHRIGTTEAFYKPALTNAASLERMARTRGIVDDIRKVLRDNGIPETSDGVITALMGAKTSVRGGSCSDSTPEDGTIVECDFQVGSTIEWMAYRPNASKGNRTPSRLERLRWAGRRSDRKSVV